MAKGYIYNEGTDSLDELKVGGGVADTTNLELAIQRAQQTADGANTAAGQAQSTANAAQTTANEAKAGLADKLDKTGTAAAATKLATARTISLSGDASGSASFNGAADASITTTLANSGVTAGSYGPSANSSPAHQGTFTVPQVTVDAKGRVTSAVNRTITLPAGATSTSVSPATETPEAPGTAAVGTSARYAREDHVHPLQTTISGNAGSATKLATARNIALTGDVTGSASFNGTANASITATLANSGATAGSYGPSSNSSPAHSGTFTVPQVTVDAKGRVTSAVNRTITLPAAGTSSDTKVTQTVTTTNNTYPLLFTYTANQTATATSGVRFASAVKVNPSTQQIIAKGFQTASGAYHSSFPFPSTTKVRLTLGASGATYTAPGDGWYVLKKEFATQLCTPSFQGNAYMNMTTWASPLDQEDPKFTSTVIGPYCNYGGTVFAPVVKGDTIKVLYDVAGKTDLFYFVYAMGAV